MKHSIYLSAGQIREIAQFLDGGFRCFYNLKTREIRTTINFDCWPDSEEDAWAEIEQELESNREDYFEFSGLESFEVFRVMADFAFSIDDPELHERLTEALERPRPFSNFKWLVDRSGPYRQQWFDYKNSRYMERVKKQIELYNREREDG